MFHIKNITAVSDLIEDTLKKTQIQTSSTIKDLITYAIILTTYTKRKTIVITYLPCIKYHIINPVNKLATRYDIQFPNNEQIIIHYHNDDNIIISHPVTSFKLTTNHFIFTPHDNNYSNNRISININEVLAVLHNMVYEKGNHSLWLAGQQQISISKYQQKDNPILNQLIKQKLLINHNRSTTSLRITSLNTTSANHMVTTVQQTRMKILKQHLVQNYSTPDQIDVFCIQETMIGDHTEQKYNHHDFDQYFDQFYIPWDFSNNRRWRGQAILINKQLQAKQLTQHTDQKYGSILPIRCRFQSFNFIIASIYINPTSKDEQIELLVKTINDIATTYPDDEVIFIGDYNINAEAIQKRIISLMNNNRPICNHNADNKITFIRGKVERALDHAVSVTNQNLKYTLSSPSNITNIVTEHLPIQLDLIKSNQQKPNNRNTSPLLDATHQHLQQQLDEMKQIITKHDETLNWLQNQSNQRLLMDNSYAINSNEAWVEYNDEINKISQEIDNDHYQSQQIEPLVNELCLKFYHTLLESTGKYLRQRKTTKKHMPGSQIIAKKSQKPFQHLMKWKLLNNQFNTKPFKLVGLTIQTTRRIIDHNVQRYRKNMLQFWRWRETKFINDKVKKYIQMNTKQNQFEAEKFIEQIADSYSNVKTKKTNTEIRTINPITNVLATSNKQTAQNFTTAQQQYEQKKSNQSTTAEQVANDVVDSAHVNEKDILAKVKQLLYPTQPIQQKDEYKWLNNMITTSETEQAIINGDPFTSAGPDRIPHSVLKVALHTNTKGNTSGKQIDPTKLLTQKTLTNVDVHADIKIQIEDYSRHFETSKTNECTPMLKAITSLLNIVFSTGITPRIWQITEIVNMPKTGIPSNNTNDYRPISLSSTIQKVLNKILNSRLLQITPQITHNNQCGYSHQRSRSEAILGLYDYLSTTPDKTAHSIFIDLAKAFNSLPHDKLNTVLQQKLGQTDSRICNYIKNLYDNLYYFNNVNSSTSTIEKQQFGIKQGCTISSTLFIIYFDLIIDGITKMMNKLSPLSACRTRREIIDFLAGYADDLAISSQNKTRLNIYIRLATKLLKIAQLDLNTTKTKILITNTANNNPPTQNTYKVKINNNEEHEFEVVKNFRYLGFTFHHDLKFIKTCRDLKIGFLKYKYNAIIKNRAVPVYVKKLIIQRYFLSKLLANAPIIGTMLCQNPQNVKIFKEQITNPFSETIKSIFNMRNVQWQTATPNLYENLKIPTPHHFAILQAFSTIVKLTATHDKQTNQHKQMHSNPGLNDYVKHRIINPCLNSPIFLTIQTLIKKTRKIKMPYVEKPTYLNQQPIDGQEYFLQQKWLYDGLNSLPSNFIDLIHTTPYYDILSTCKDLCFHVKNEIKHTHKIHHSQHNISTPQLIQDKLEDEHQITINQSQAKAILGHQHQILNKVTSIYDVHDIHQHIPPKLIKGDKPDWYTLLLQSATNKSYSKSIPTIFKIKGIHVENIIQNAYSQQSRIMKTATIFYHQQTALSSDLVNKLEMMHSNYNWVLIHNLRLCRWDGFYFQQNVKIQKICHCGEQFTYRHMLLCPEYQVQRHWAIHKTWDKLKIHGVDGQIHAAINQQSIMARQIQKKSKFISDNTKDKDYKTVLSTNNIKRITDYYKEKGCPTFVQRVQKRTKKVTIDPKYYLHLIKWRDSNKHVYKMKCLPSWIDDTNNQLIKTTMRYFFLMYKHQQLQSLTSLPNHNNIDLFLLELDRNNKLHHLHSPPQCPDNTIYGTVLVLFLAEFINLIEDDLDEWTYNF